MLTKNYRPTGDFQNRSSSKWDFKIFCCFELLQYGLFQYEEFSNITDMMQ